MDEGEALESDAQSAKVVQPSNAAFDDPARLAQSAAVGFSATGNLSMDTEGVERPAMFVMIVAAIALDDDRLAQQSPLLTSDRRNGLDQRQQLGDVVTVGTGQDDCERDALRFGDEVVLGAGTSAVGGIGSCF